MRKALIILLLFAVFFNEIGYYFYYSYQQYLVKCSVKKELLQARGDAGVEVLALEQVDQYARWEEEGKEFLLNGEMFDVKRTETINGKTFLHCIKDVKEEALINKINLASGGLNGKSTSEKNKHVLKLQVKDCEISSSVLLSFPTILSQLQFSTFIESARCNSTEIITPPPRYC